MTTKTIFASLMMTVLVLPSVSYGAQLRMGDGMSGKNSSSTPEKNICTNLDTIRANALSKLDARAMAVGGRRGDHREGVDAKRGERMTMLVTKRAEHDNKRSDHYDKLRSKASTTEQKAAVETFSKTVEELVAARKAAIDAAIKTFEDGVADLRGSVDTTTDDLKNKVKADINRIFDEADAACDAGKTAPEVRAIIKIGMETMKINRKDSKGTYTFKDDFEALRAARKTAEQKAISDFKTKLEEAKKTLKAAF